MNFTVTPIRNPFVGCLLLAFFAARLFSQNLQITPGNVAPFTPENLISNVFLGQGVNVLSIQYDGQDDAVGYFSGGTNAIGINRGILLTTGLAATDGFDIGADSNGSAWASVDNGSNADGDELDPLISGSPDFYNVAKYTITFIPTSDTIQFRYAFASEEYPEFGCSDYNDVFGFFIQGPGYPTPKNIALIPGTNNAVSINNIHPQNPVDFSCKPLNIQYYNDNNGLSKQPAYDGYTDVFTAMAIVQPCKTYTIKLVIADVTDEVYDSGVFLEAKSFSSNALIAEVVTASNDGTVTEGCSDGMLRFSLTDPAKGTTTINYNIWGSGTNGTDIQSIPNNLTIPVGATQVEIPIKAIEDNMAEGKEFIALDFQKDPCRRDTIYIYVRDNSILPPQLRPDTSLCISGSANLKLDATLPIPTPQPFVFSNQNDVNINGFFLPVTSSLNVVGVQPPVLTTDMIRSVCINVDHNWLDDLEIFLIAPNGSFMELTTDNGGQGDDYTNTCFTPTASQNIGNFPNSGAPFTGNYQPEGDWADIEGTKVNGTWKLQVRDDQFGVTGTLRDWTITFEPSYKIDYQWTPTAGLSCTTCPDPTATNSTTQTYIVKASDNYGCEVADTVKIEIEQTLAAPQVTCTDANETSVTFSWANVAGANGYEVNVGGTSNWQPATGNSFTVNNLQGGTPTTLLVQAIGSGSLKCPPLVDTAVCRTCEIPLLQIATVPPSCYNTTDATLTLTPSNTVANPPYTFKFGNQTNSTGQFSGLAAGNFTATITDKDGCQKIENVQITAPPPVVSTVQIAKPISCAGQNDGSIEVFVSGGTGSTFSHQWSGGQTTAILTNLAPGNFTVTSTDSKGCTATATISLQNPPAINLAVAATDLKCFGKNNGSATATPSGGNGNFTFAWSNGQTGQTASNLPAGNFTVTATDAGGCTKTASVTVAQPPQLAATVAETPATCFGENSGSATATPSGGTPPFNFLWSDPQKQDSATAKNLAAGSFLVTISDANGCTVQQNIAVSQPAPIEVLVNTSNARCFGEPSGSIKLTATGGNGSFNFSWKNMPQQTSNEANDLAAGNYEIVLTDAKGCSKTIKTDISQPEKLVATAVLKDVKCNGNLTGKIDIAPTGGSKPYQFSWSNGQTTQNLFNQPAGNFTLTLTDANGCNEIFQHEIKQPTDIAAEILPTNVKCFGEKTGKISIVLSGGTGNFKIQWAGAGGFSSQNLNLENLAAGNYTATATDAEGCFKIFQTKIEQPAAALATNLPELSDTVCFDKSNGKIVAQPTGGTQPYNFQWLGQTGAQSGASIENLPIGFYKLTVTDANGCTAADSTAVTQQQPIFAVLDSESPLCHNGTDGKAKITKIFYGATAFKLDEFEYEWQTTPKQFGTEAFNLAAGTTYSVIATDRAGCTVEQEIAVGNHEAVGGQIDSSGNVLCAGGREGWAVVSGTGGVGNFKFLWSPNSPIQNGQVAKNLAAGKFVVTVTDANGCFGKHEIVISEPKPLKISFQKTDIKCFGDTNGKAKAIASGGTPNYQFAWSNGSQTAEAQQLGQGFVTAQLTDANGCKLLDSIKIAAPGSPLVGKHTKKDAVCYGSATGEIKLAGEGGEPPYRYSLDGTKWNGSTKQIGLKAGVYRPHVMDKNGCMVELDEVKIEQRGQIKLDLGPDITISLGDDTQLLPKIENATAPFEYLWSLEDSVWLSCVDCDAPFVNGLKYQNTFELYVVDSAGCTAEDLVVVFVEKIRKVFVPTGFSPNGDFSNDLLLVHGQKEVKILDFKVFDRWGELVFQAENFDINDATIGWDGTFRGKNMPPDVYVWTMEVEYLQDGVREVFKGHSTLIR